jgi:hypothetical protein
VPLPKTNHDVSRLLPLRRSGACRRTRNDCLAQTIHEPGFGCGAAAHIICHFFGNRSACGHLPALVPERLWNEPVRGGPGRNGRAGPESLAGVAQR